MVVMAIIAILSVLVIAAITAARRSAIETVNRGNARAVFIGYQAYFARYQHYPSTGDASVIFACCPDRVTESCYSSCSPNSLNTFRNAVETGKYMDFDPAFSQTVQPKLSDLGIKIERSICDNGGGGVVSDSKRVVVITSSYDCWTNLWGEVLE